MTRKPKLGFADLPSAGCRISSRPLTRYSAACRRPSPGGFTCILGLHGYMTGCKLRAMQYLEGLHSQIVLLLKCFTPRFFLLFLRSWGERTLCFLPRPGRSTVFPVSWNFFTIFHAVKRFISSHFAISTLLFLLLWSLITPIIKLIFTSLSLCTAIVKLIFVNFGIPSLTVEIVSFQMVIILQKLTTLKWFYRKTKLVALIHGQPVYTSRYIYK